MGRHKEGTRPTAAKGPSQTRQPFERPASEHQSLNIGLSPNQIKASWGGTNTTTSRSYYAVDAFRYNQSQPSRCRRPSETPAYISTSLTGTSLIGTSCDDRNVTKFDVLTSPESPSDYLQIYLDYSSYGYSPNDYLEHRSKYHTWIKRFSRASYKGC